MNIEKKRILVVDDDPHITNGLKRELEDTNDYIVAGETNATRAFATARSFRPDLIILDLTMPGKDGGELAGEFQESPQFRAVPIVILTASVTRGEVKTHKGMVGGLRFLAKPMDIPDVINCIKEQLA